MDHEQEPKLAVTVCRLVGTQLVLRGPVAGYDATSMAKSIRAHVRRRMMYLTSSPRGKCSGEGASTGGNRSYVGSAHRCLLDPGQESFDISGKGATPCPTFVPGIARRKSSSLMKKRQAISAEPRSGKPRPALGRPSGAGPLFDRAAAPMNLFKLDPTVDDRLQWTIGRTRPDTDQTRVYYTDGSGGEYT